MLYTPAALEKNAALIGLLEEKSEKSYMITPDLSRKISGTVTPQGVFCIGAVPDSTLDTDRLEKRGRYILLENVQDPSNIGAVFRTAEALGIDGALLSADCCDPYNPKTMRASMGAVFRLPFAVADDPVSEVEKQKKRGLRPLAAVPDRGAVSVTDIDAHGGVIMCVGNEGNGLTAELIAACCQSVTIPMRGRAESLNAAAAASLLMWEMVRCADG